MGVCASLAGKLGTIGLEPPPPHLVGWWEFNAKDRGALESVFKLETQFSKYKAKTKKYWGKLAEGRDGAVLHVLEDGFVEFVGKRKSVYKIYIGPITDFGDGEWIGCCPCIANHNCKLKITYVPSPQQFSDTSDSDQHTEGRDECMEVEGFVLTRSHDPHNGPYEKTGKLNLAGLAALI
eukprot:GFYU01006548.1.p1 GENE.GFYU01006548.1~~GFYU01006548.1.p1  ORF type:complete len:179 (+),score=20.76 GFYU01006548.1:204-740(+)